MAAMTLFHAEKCCHLLSVRQCLPGAYAAASASSFRRHDCVQPKNSTLSCLPNEGR